MEENKVKQYRSHGDGSFRPEDFRSIGTNVIFEKGVLVFNPDHISIGNNVYVGHNAVLKGYHKNEMSIGDDTWIGQGCFFHSAAGISIGKAVGIGPNVQILTSYHQDRGGTGPVILNDLVMESVEIEDGCDIGIGTIILPGVKIGKGSIIGAGSVVTKDVEPLTVVAGNPARFLRAR